MAWSLHSINNLFDHYAGDWQRLSDELMEAHPLFDLGFVKSVVEHFKEEPLWLGVSEGAGEVDGFVILKRNGFGRWETFQPSQMPLGLIMVRGDHHGNDGKIVRIFNSLPNFGLQLGLTHIDPDFKQIPEAQDLRLSETLIYGTTMRISIAGDFDHYWSARPKKLQQNISRYLRRLEREGITPSFEMNTDVQDMEQAVADYGEIESAGWKGKNGSAIHKDNIQGKFYVSVLEKLAQEGQARVYRLYFNERCVAMRLTIEKNGLLVFLKTTYDEEVSRYAPGRILLYMVIKDMFEKGYVNVAEFYTKATRDQLQWTSETRDIYHVNYYRSPFWKWLVNTGKKIT